MGSNQPTNQPGNKSTIQTNCKQTLRNQPNNMPANQLTIEQLQVNNPRLSQLYILIYQMASNVIRMAMIGYQPTIKTHQNQG